MQQFFRPATVPYLPGGVFWLVLFRERSLKACPSGQGQQPWRERRASGSFPGRSKPNNGEVRGVAGRGETLSGERQRALLEKDGVPRVHLEWGGLALVGVLSSVPPLSGWPRGVSGKPPSSAIPPHGAVAGCWGGGPLFPSGSLLCGQSLGNHDIAWPRDLSRVCRP